MLGHRDHIEDDLSVTYAGTGGVARSERITFAQGLLRQVFHTSRTSDI